MNVKIIDATYDPLTLLIYTKNTRLRGQVSMDDIQGWSYNKRLEHLEYMKGTIQSAFEFVRYTFEITGVSRSFTHQLVRTRNAVYAQESQRTVDVRDAEVLGVPSEYKIEAHELKELYGAMIDAGHPVQDARQILPNGIETSIIMNVSLRELMHMAEVRLCTRTAGEYQEVFKAMKAEVESRHPEFTNMLEVHCVKHGTCCFPNYTECPVQDSTFKVDDGFRSFVREAWEETDHVANPIAKDGKTM